MARSRVCDRPIQSGMPLGAVEAQIIAAPEAQQARTASLDGISNAFQAKYGLLPTEAATLSPSSADYAKLLGPGADVGTVGAGRAVNTLGAGPAIGTLGPGFTADTLQGALTGTVGAGQDVGTIGAGPAQQAQTVFSGRFDPNAYLAANPDVAAAHMDPLKHYETYGYNEGRALDPQGDRLGQGFNASAYLAQNPDVRAAGMDPLAHYLEYGAAEGRALPTGGNPTAFTNANTSGGVGNPYSFSNFNVAQGLGAGNGSFGLGSATGGGGGSTGVTAASGASNALGGSGGSSGSAFGYTDAGGNQQTATFNPQASEQSYLKDQVNQTNALIAAGQQGTANNPNLANAALFNLGAQVQAQQINGVNPALVGGTSLAAAGTNFANPIINIGTPVLPGGLNAINGFGGPLNGGVSFGGHGGFF